MTEQEIKRLSDELKEAKELLECIRNGTDVSRPEVDLDGILLTREFENRVASFLAKSTVNPIRDFIMRKKRSNQKELGS